PVASFGTRRFTFAAVQRAADDADHREPDKRPEVGGRTDEAELDAAVEREMGTEFVDDSRVERSDRGGVDVISRKPEELDVRIPSVCNGRADRCGHQMLHEMRPSLCADRAD